MHKHAAAFWPSKKRHEKLLGTKSYSFAKSRGEIRKKRRNNMVQLERYRQDQAEMSMINVVDDGQGSCAKRFGGPKKTNFRCELLVCIQLVPEISTLKWLYQRDDPKSLHENAWFTKHRLKEWNGCLGYRVPGKYILYYLWFGQEILIHHYWDLTKSCGVGLGFRNLKEDDIYRYFFRVFFYQAALQHIFINKKRPFLNVMNWISHGFPLQPRKSPGVSP